MECFEWQDEHNTGVVGWIVIDSVTNGCSAGRIYISSDASKEDCCFRAAQASLSSAIAVPHTGGAAAMIRVEGVPAIGTMESIMTSFLSAHLPLLANTLVLVGSTDAETVFIDRTLKRLNLSGAQHAFSQLYAKATGQEDKGKLFGPLTNWMSSQTPLSDLAQSFAVCQIVKCLSETFFSRTTRVAIFGFGCIASSIAYWIEEQGIGTVSAIFDADGSISMQEGLPIAEILEIRSVALRRRCLLGQSLSEKIRTTENILCNLDEAQSLRFNASTHKHNVEAEFVIFCDGANELTIGLLDSVKETQFAVSAFGKDGHYQFCADKVKEVERRKVTVVPQWVCMAGKDQVMRAITAVSFDFRLLERGPAIVAVLECISAPLITFLQEACTPFQGQRPNSIVLACEATAKRRIANPKPFCILRAEQMEMKTSVFVDSAKMQADISKLMSEVSLLFRAVFRNHNDKVLLEMLDDLILHFLAPQLQRVYCSDDCGERKGKALFLRFLNGVRSFLKACATATQGVVDCDPESVVSALFLLRSPEFATESKAASAFLDHFQVPFKPGTLILVVEEAISAGKALVILDSWLKERVVIEKKASDSDSFLDIEEHKDEFGLVIGDIIRSVCEIAQVPYLVQLVVRTFLFFGGEYFLGGKLDRRLEPDIGDDITLVGAARDMVRACQETHAEEAVLKQRITKRLQTIISSSCGTEKIAKLIVGVFASPCLIRELIYFHIIPALIRNDV